ncbi:plasmid partitioning protein RepB [Acidimangrovimonas sediminis]|uniref:plasmid partitioning protein RepB n=1 Tax=Acidimangrovimonas sediminis TaxID=2056283 RepID=UPI000C7F7F88|nr:plasmid partitioning protein RepB [Acidimangrovimonas sediminis]
MARKNLLEGLMKAGGEDAPPLAPAQPRRQSGAIGAVSQSLADLRTRAIAEVPADMIDDAGLKDRLDEDEAGIAELMESLREYGQQVPVMLRHSPNVEGRYEIVYGRRRVAAMKRLGVPVRAMVRDLDDRSLVVAQGQENAARKDLSFIEKANFARQMVEGGFDRKVICDALHVDKTVVSRMLAVTKEVPEPVILSIGAAPSAGRDRWLALARRIAAHPLDKVISLAVGDDSDARFQAVFDALAPQKANRPAETITREDGTALADAARRGGKPVMTFHDDRFADWLRRNMARLHEEFSRNGGQ